MQCRGRRIVGSIDGLELEEIIGMSSAAGGEAAAKQRLWVREPSVLVSSNIILRCWHPGLEAAASGQAQRVHRYCRVIASGLDEGRAVVEFYKSVDSVDGLEADIQRMSRHSVIDVRRMRVVVIVDVGDAKDADNANASILRVDNILKDSGIGDYILVFSFGPSVKPELAAWISAEAARVLGRRFALTVPVPDVSHGCFERFINEFFDLAGDEPDIAGIVVDFRKSYLPSKSLLNSIGKARSLLEGDDSSDDNSSGLIAINARGSPRSRIAWLVLAPYFGFSAVGLNHLPLPVSDDTVSYRVPGERLVYLSECRGCSWFEARVLTYGRMIKAYRLYEQGMLDAMLDADVKGEMDRWLRELKRSRTAGVQTTLDAWMA